MLKPPHPGATLPAGRKTGTAEPIPVLFMLTSFDRGGAEKILTRYAMALPREKYAVRAVALQGRSQAMAQDLARAEIPVHDLGMTWKGDLRVVPRLAHLLREWRIQCNEIRSKGVIYGAGLVIAGLVALLVIGFKGWIFHS